MYKILSQQHDEISQQSEIGQMNETESISPSVNSSNSSSSSDQAFSDNILTVWNQFKHFFDLIRGEYDTIDNICVI